ncbi:diaminopimelate dehydrogenase [Pseudobacteroides cellulosolvens]|uniref:Meso-diaminopimelate D-dehydrogenase n=1 Tax=Pseudobacteroides cellulosolvens ATCC 35603 = DSM 2933 TaxID=398512 RepID=A0A0L6JQ28_9FIRM|nr:diaminopimelate dehydrogenase [Pseudobacteroides cellulosolvens]KNY27889.1 diaminopimelate dehydrogenase [Pseudobacteroides cellulosolvens ATCC 35603 = DSM 2933]
MIRIGIVGYGNLGKGVELAIKQNSDMKLTYVFTRRAPEDIKLKDSSVKVMHVSDAEKLKNEIDVMILCGGSATDLPEQGPVFARMFNTVDSFDTHAKIPQYFEAVDQASKAAGKVGIISVGWDPGLFSMNRMLAEAVLPQGTEYTFWGRGVSQGHSDAIRRVKGVKGGVQYTIPKDEAIQRVRNGENPNLTTKEKHLRDCYVVVEEGADKAAIEKEIKNMPNYFADYETKVTFISEEELKKNHSAMPHGGFVIRSGNTGENTKHIIEFSLKLDSNPEFTASVLVAAARAAYRLSSEGQSGAKTMFDIPLGYLSIKSAAQLRKELL